MKIYEIGTGYTSIPADKGAATEIVVENLSKAFVKLGHDVTVVDIEDPNRLPTNLPIVEVPMPCGFGATDEALGVRHKLKRVVYSAKLAGVLKCLLKDEDEKVVLHFHNQYNAYFFYKLVPARLRSKAFVVYTNHSGAWNGEWSEIEAVIRRRYFQEWDAQKKADLVFVLNETTAKNVIKHVGVSQDKVVMAQNGVNTELFKPLSEERHEAFRQSIIPGCEYLVFQCGSICPNKAQLEAVRLLASSMRKTRSLHYVYAGGIVDALYAKEIAIWCEKNGFVDQVHYLGELPPGDELASWYSAADCFVFPSGYEAFSLSELESLSSGTPVLQKQSARIVSFASSEEGLMSFSNGAEFEEKVRLLLYGIDRKKLSLAARACVLERFSWEAVAVSQLSEIENHMLRETA